MHDGTKLFFSSVRQAHDGASARELPTFVEASCKTRLRRTIPSREVDLNSQKMDTLDSVQYQYSLSIPGCMPKHHRKRPVIAGSKYTGAILSDADTFLAYMEYMLCYHAWCHYSHKLPRELQKDHDLIDYGSRMVVQYFDSILYWGDNTVDADTCKVHTQLHNAPSHHYFGDLMQYNTAMGEHGLKVWAKRVSRTALKHGRDKIHF